MFHYLDVKKIALNLIYTALKRIFVYRLNFNEFPLHNHIDLQGTFFYIKTLADLVLFPDGVESYLPS